MYGRRHEELFVMWSAARAEATQAAFIHKTLVIWVALLAVPLLGESLGAPHVLAIGLLIAGQVWLAGDPGTVTFGAGEAMILAATLLWSVEVILVKRLVGPLGSRPLAAARMALGTVVLVGWLGVTGRLGDLFALSADQWSWALLTGSLLNYAMPRAADLPSFIVATETTACTHNPLGVKGCGEAGAIGICPAVINAVVDALSGYGITHIDMPASPERVWRAIQAAKGSRA